MATFYNLVTLSAVFTAVRSQGLTLVVESPSGPNVCGNTCCRGWRLDPVTNKCTIPGCWCLNGGRCIGSTNVCYCPFPFYGPRCQYKESLAIETTYRPPIITTEPLIARHYMRGPCFRVITSDECKAPIADMHTLHDDCCTTVGKAWGNPCFICPQQIGKEKDCEPGFKMDPKANWCVDVNECEALEGICGNGICRNSYGSYQCSCNIGFSLDSSGTLCVASVTGKCFRRNPRGSCSDAVGNRMTQMQCCCSIGKAWGGNCDACPRRGTDDFRALCPYGEGYQVIGASGQKLEIDECMKIPGLCKNGRCLNTLGSYRCLCDPGYRVNRLGTRCIDIDECNTIPAPCSNGDCRNTKGSFHCVCQEGYYLTGNTFHCMDIDECSVGDICYGRKCLNTLGSYHCMQPTCGEGYKLVDNGNRCEDIDECEDDMTCLHGGCINNEGGHRCVCYSGYMPSQDGKDCIDINECDIDKTICGEGSCINNNGGFQCECAPGLTFHQRTKLCKDESKKDCYTNLNELQFCENVIGTNVSRDDCCCSLGEGWGDNCNLWPCPLVGTSTFNELCPGGKGKILLGSQEEGHRLEDINECEVFDGLCPNGECVNIDNSYVCECHKGFQLNLRTQECLDVNECYEQNVCDQGNCVNTPGSYSCECESPMVLDESGQRCTAPVPTYVDPAATGNCWTRLSNELICNSAMDGDITTFTECCCVGGVGWGLECRLCPLPNSKEHESLCADFEPKESLRSGLRETKSSIVASRSDGQELELDCGFVDGCVNGRCVKVNKGYTCDCYRGFQLVEDSNTCQDIDECKLLGNTLCWNARCINTPGSFRCVCKEGHVEATRNFCIKIPS
ncbi:latent-transforming growth factor beta-binding protein 3-like isoform X2 [Glandiceps talaboti]